MKIKIPPRRKEVAQLIALGNTNKEIAALTGKSIKTVEKQRDTLYKKYKLRCSADVARWAIANNLIENDFSEVSYPTKKEIFATHAETKIDDAGTFEIGEIDTPYEVLLLLFGSPIGYKRDSAKREWRLRLFNGARLCIYGDRLLDRSWVVASDHDTPNSFAILRGILSDPINIVRMRLQNRLQSLHGKIARLRAETCATSEEIDGVITSILYMEKKFTKIYDV